MSESTNERTSVFNSHNPQSTLFSVNMSSITKLTNLNYLMWSRQVRALLEGHELQHFIEVSNAAPSPTILIEGVSAPNPAYAPWRRQDRLLYNSLIRAISLPFNRLSRVPPQPKTYGTFSLEPLGIQRVVRFDSLNFRARHVRKAQRPLSSIFASSNPKMMN